MESITFRKADVKEAEVGLWSNIFVLLLKFRINFYVKTCLCVHRHIVPLCMCVVVDAVIASYCGIVKQPYNVPLFYSSKTVQTSVKCYFELQFIQ